MIRSLLVALCALYGLSASAQTPQTEDEKTLYALGTSIGESLAPFDMTPAELAFVVQGMTDAHGGKVKAELTTFKMKINDLAQARMTRKAQAFLSEEAKKPGVVKTESGLLYTELKAGEGASPKASDNVTVHYKGTLVDGTEFDSSYGRGEPTTFPLSGVIKCWTEGVQRMKPGGKARLVCPSDIAYGMRGAPPAVPPGATLIFEIQLLKVGN